jgi:hypothetical protein
MPPIRLTPARKIAQTFDPFPGDEGSGVPPAKRRRDLARSLPALAEVLAKRFTELADVFIAEFPHPQRGGATPDALNFAAWLLQTQKLSQKAASLANAICTRHRWSPSFAASGAPRQIAWRGRVLKVR